MLPGLSYAECLNAETARQERLATAQRRRIGRATAAATTRPKAGGRRGLIVAIRHIGARRRPPRPVVAAALDAPVLVDA